MPIFRIAGIVYKGNNLIYNTVIQISKYAFENQRKRMYSKFYELFIENCEKQGVEMKFSRELFFYSLEENPYKTNILKLLDFDAKTKFYDLAYFSLNHSLWNQKSSPFIKLRMSGLSLSNFQRVIVKKLIKSGNYRKNKIIIENNLFSTHEIVSGSFQLKKDIVKESLRKHLFSVFINSPNWMKSLLRILWRKL